MIETSTSSPKKNSKCVFEFYGYVESSYFSDQYKIGRFGIYKEEMNKVYKGEFSNQ